MLKEENNKVKASQSEGMSIFHDCVLTIRDKLNYQTQDAVALSGPD